MDEEGPDNIAIIIVSFRILVLVYLEKCWTQNSKQNNLPSIIRLSSGAFAVGLAFCP